MMLDVTVVVSRAEVSNNYEISNYSTDEASTYA
jgi:hypothetical protein